MGKREKRWVREREREFGWKGGGKERERVGGRKEKGRRSVPRVPMVFKTYVWKQASTPVYHPAQLSLRQPFPSLSCVLALFHHCQLHVFASSTRRGREPRLDSCEFFIVSTVRREEQRAPGPAFFFFVPSSVFPPRLPFDRMVRSIDFRIADFRQFFSKRIFPPNFISS